MTERINLFDAFARIKDAAYNVHHLTNLSRWIEKYTKLDGEPFSFLDHEFQRDIIDDPCKTLYVVKCAQVGLSEIFARWCIAAATTQDNFTVIWTFPNSTDAEKFCKARLDPFISSSQEVLRRISNIVNSTELKKFGANSFVYIRGTQSETGALSVPADLLIHDEYDRSDMANISAYVSRLQHKPTKMRRVFSTPTINKYGISLEAETSRRMRQMLRCSHCNHHFLPSYESDVKIPGWDRNKKEINKNNLKDINWQQAVLLCPSCGKAPDMALQYREWVQENLQQAYPDKTYYVSPFCLSTGKNALTPSYLVKASTDFAKWSEFVNQGLGLTAEDEDESLTESDVRRSLVQGDFSSSDIHYFGADMGLVCHVTIAKLVEDKLVAVHRERVVLSQFQTRRQQLMAQYRCINSVHDVYPYTETIQTITEYDPNAYGALYVDAQSAAAFTIKDTEENTEEGKLNVRLVKINRSVALDELMYMFKRGEVIVAKQDDYEEFVTHMNDMKRVQKFDKHGGVVYRWVKTQGLDHWHHSLLYAFIASKLRGTMAMIEPGIPSVIATVRINSLTNKGRPLTLWRS